MSSLAKWFQLNYPFRNQIYRMRQSLAAKRWDGTGPAPHPVKQRNIKKYASKHQLRILVETGTYYGDMVEAMRDTFDRIYSIEVSKSLFEKAKRRFAKYPHIQILHGDSAIELGRIVSRLTAPALFWLDGHYSGGITEKGALDTPIYDELAHILSSTERHVILIDDARCFGLDPNYPAIEELTSFIGSRTVADIHKQDDALIIEPRA